MATRPPVFRGSRGPRAEQARAYEARRGSARARGYTPAWDAASKRHLAEHPLCAYCALNDAGRVTAATCVDHLYPQQLWPHLFWEETWWVSSCAPCHAGFKQALEHRGRAALDALCAALGLPLPPP